MFGTEAEYEVRFRRSEIEQKDLPFFVNFDIVRFDVAVWRRGYQRIIKRT